MNLDLSGFTLGTAQLGMPYGLTNRYGKPTPAECEDILRLAFESGVSSVDCARAYGEAEERLGRALARLKPSEVQVVTKLDPMLDLPVDSPVPIVRERAKASLEASRRMLGLEVLAVVLLHRWEHRRLWDETAWDVLLEARARGIVGSLGASVQTPKEALEALADPAVEYIQLPLNILDRRWKSSQLARARAARKDVTVHARSVFLQGVLTGDLAIWPMLPEGTTVDWRALVSQILGLVGQLGRHSVMDLCLSYVRAQSWIDSLVLGVATQTQLRENITLFERPPLSLEEVDLLEEILPGGPENLLNPAFWLPFRQQAAP